MKNRSLPAQLLAGLLLTVAALSLTACGNIIYREPASNYSGRPIPPSGLLERVLVAYTSNGSSGGLEILDGLRNLRSNVQNTTPAFFIKGYSAAQPVQILNFPEQTSGYVLSYTDGNLANVNYSSESSTGSAASFGANPPSAAAAPAASLFAGTSEQSGALVLSIGGSSTVLNLPNVNKVVVNPGASIILAMVRNSNALYRVVKLPATNNPASVIPYGSIDCEPLLLPVYCIVRLAGTYDRPTNAVFSLDGNTVYVLDCGPECGGSKAGVTFLNTSDLLITNVPSPLASQPPPSPMSALPVANPVLVPGGVTAGLSDGTTLYLAGQQLQGSGLFSGNLSLLNLATYTVGSTYSISDGLHTKMLFGDDNTLWIGSQQCASGTRAAAATAGGTTQAANFNCLTRFVPNAPVGGPNAILPAWTANTTYVAGQQIADGCPPPNTGCSSGNIEYVLTGGNSGGGVPSWNTTLDKSTTDGGVTWVNIGPVSQAEILPVVTPNNPYATVTASNPIDTNVIVPYLNTNLNNYYYGNLTGECWVQNYHKIYTAYGGQIHAFNTVDGSEINNYLITIQGTALDVAYMDAESNSAN